MTFIFDEIDIPVIWALFIAMSRSASPESVRVDGKWSMAWRQSGQIARFASAA